MRKKLLTYAYFGVCTAILLSVNAGAYLDPSTMTYLIQIIAGVLIAAGATAGIVWHKLKRAVRKNKDKNNQPTDVPADGEEEKDEDEAD